MYKKILYYLLSFLFLIALLTLTIISIVFDFYLKMYSVLAVSFVWYSYILLFISQKKQTKIKITKKPFSVVIPVYNEPPKSLISTVKSIINSQGNKEIFIIDD